MTVDAQPVVLSDRLRRFLDAPTPRYATIATTNADGSPHQVVIWFLQRGDVLVVNSRRGRRWPANLGREGRASISVYEKEDAVTLSCVVEDSYEGEPAQADIAAMAKRYDPPEDAERGIARFRTEQRVSFLLRPVAIHQHGDPN